MTKEQKNERNKRKRRQQKVDGTRTAHEARCKAAKAKRKRREVFNTSKASAQLIIDSMAAKNVTVDTTQIKEADAQP
jgi:hypothetical protein